jgi:hypothetical protein
MIRVAAQLAVGVVAIAVVIYKLSPTDLERADADVKRAWVVINVLEDEAQKNIDDARGHRARAAEIRQTMDKSRGITDPPWFEWCAAKAENHTRLANAKRDRRDSLLHLTVEYLRLLAEAECEIIRAKNARDHGTPYEVAPRVREILTPVLAGR